jgi:polysaccharide export outer membrane protein
MSRLRWLLLVLSAVVLIVPLPLSGLRAQVSDKAYVIGPEDILEVQVWERKDLNQTVFVRPDGRTSLPLVGEIMVAGKTIQELQDHLAKVYEKTVPSAIVTVVGKRE